MAATAARGQLADGSTSRFTPINPVYLCAKFGAFIKKCTIRPILAAKLLDYFFGRLR